MLWKMTTIGMYNYGQMKSDDLFEHLVLPEGMDREVVINQILITTGELPIAYPDYEFFKDQIRVWSKSKQPIFEKMIWLMNQEFNPLHNYDRMEEYDDIEVNKGTNNIKTNSNIKTVSNIKNKGGSDSTNQVTSYDSEDLKIADKNISNSSANTDSSDNTDSSANTEGSNTNDRTFKHRAHLYGNIGITTSVDMLTQAFEWYQRDIPELIAEEFKCYFCLGIYC